MTRYKFFQFISTRSFRFFHPSENYRRQEGRESFFGKNLFTSELSSIWNNGREFIPTMGHNVTFFNTIYNIDKEEWFPDGASSRTHSRNTLDDKKGLNTIRDTAVICVAVIRHKVETRYSIIEEGRRTLAVHACSPAI